MPHVCTRVWPISCSRVARSPQPPLPPCWPTPRPQQPGPHQAGRSAFPPARALHRARQPPPRPPPRLHPHHPPPLPPHPRHPPLPAAQQTPGAPRRRGRACACSAARPRPAPLCSCLASWRGGHRAAPRPLSPRPLQCRQALARLPRAPRQARRAPAAWTAGAAASRLRPPCEAARPQSGQRAGAMPGPAQPRSGSSCGGRGGRQGDAGWRVVGASERAMLTHQPGEAATYRRSSASIGPLSSCNTRHAGPGTQAEM